MNGEIAEFGSDPNYGSEIGGSGQIGVAAVSNYYWRLDFDIGSSGADDLVERIEVHPSSAGSKKVVMTSVLTSELGEDRDPQLKRGWRVRVSVPLLALSFAIAIAIGIEKLREDDRPR